MKKLLILLSFSFFLFACSKEKSYEIPVDNSFYIKCKLDGKDRVFAYNAMAVTTDAGGSGVLSLSASAASDPTNMEGIALSIGYFNFTPGTGTYTEDDTSGDYSLSGVYNPNSATVIYGAGLVFPSAAPLTLIIKTKTDTEVTGTFSGAFYKTDVTTGDMDTTFINITDGSFRLKVLK